MTHLQTLHNLLPINLASLSFVYVYLPLCLCVYYLAPAKLRAGVLTTSSLGFYALSSPRYLGLAVISILIDYILVHTVAVTGRPFWKKSCFWLCVTKNLALIIYFGIIAQTKLAPAPLGLLVYCLSGIDSAVAAYRAKNPRPFGFTRFAAYVSFFPRLYAGPLVTPESFFTRLGEPELDVNGVITGFGRFTSGTLKYAVAGRGLFLLYESICSISQDNVSVLSSWSLVLSFLLALYFTLSGLSDIARGIAGMFGLSLPQNFYYPYQSQSVSDFYGRFNMTSGSFLKRAVLDPLSRAEADKAGDCVNLLLAGMLWGLWFGLRINCILWGAVISVFMIMEKYLYPVFLENLPTLFRRIYTFCVVILSFSVFAADTPAASLRYLGWMFNTSGSIPFLNDRILYMLSSNWLLLLLSCFFATSAASLLVNFLRKAFPRVSLISLAIVDTGILLLFTALSLGGAAG